MRFRNSAPSVHPYCNFHGSAGSAWMGSDWVFPAPGPRWQKRRRQDHPKWSLSPLPGWLAAQRWWVCNTEFPG